MSDVYTRKNTTVGVAAQTAWGTAIVDSAAFMEISCGDTQIQPDVNVREFAVNRGRRVKDENDFVIDEGGAMPTLELPNIPVRQDDMAVLLYSFFQNVAQVAVTPFKKTFTFPTSQPEFDNDEGYVLSAIHKMPVASTSYKILDCIGTRLTIRAEPKGVIMATLQLTGRGAMLDNSNPTGTWTLATASYWEWNQCDRFTFDFGSSVSPNIGAWELDLVKTIDPIGFDGSGNPQTIVTDKYGGTFKTTILWNSETEGLRGFFKAGTVGDLRLGWGNATAGTDDGDLDFAMHGKLTDAPISSSVGLETDITFELMADGTTTEAITVIVADANQQTGWPT